MFILEPLVDAQDALKGLLKALKGFYKALDGLLKVLEGLIAELILRGLRQFQGAQENAKGRARRPNGAQKG